jgi:hypothetical protein
MHVFKSTHPDVLDAWEKLADELAEHSKRELALISELEDQSGEKREARMRGSFSYPTFMGFTATERDINYGAPRGWRVKTFKSRTSSFQVYVLIPNERLKVGKEIAAKIEACRRSGPTDPRISGKFPGVPGSFMTMPGLEKMEDAVFLVYSKDPAVIKDPRWEPCKLSEYYALREKLGKEDDDD